MLSVRVSLISNLPVQTQPPITQQLANNAPIPPGLISVASPLLPDQQVLYRMRNFPQQTYNLNFHSHLVKLMSVLLGPAATGQLRQRALINRLRESMSSTFFTDLDSFWGGILGIARNSTQQLEINPYTTASDTSTWVGMSQSDSSYRDTLYQAIRAIANYGPSAMGIAQVAQAILQCPVQLTEHYYSSPSGQYSWYVTITPHEAPTVAQQYDLVNILNKIKPANIVITLAGPTNDVYTSVPIANYFATSNYWEIQSTSSSSEIYGSTTIPQYAFGGSQSAYWTLNASVSGALSYCYNSNGTVATSTDFERIVWADGTATNYSPQYALASASNSIYGGLAINSQANPLNQSQTLSDILLAGAAPDLVQSSTTITSQTVPQFWSTPARAYTDQSQDVIEIRFVSAITCNSISFELANFPHTAYLQIYDDSQATWLTYYTQTIATSSPAILPNPYQALIAKTHPQHFGPNAWVSVSVRPSPGSFTRARVVLIRPGVNGPTGPVAAVNGLPTPYSLGLNEMSFDYVVDSETAIPTLGGTIGASSDVAQNTITYSLYEETPNMAASQWRSAPQPTNNTVVNYYIDTRSEGTAQVVDRFYIEPTHMGVNCNLYYTTQQPIGDGPSPDITIGEITSNVTITPQGAVFSTTESGTISATTTLPTGDWWLGLSLIVSSATIASNIPIVLFGDMGIYVNNGQFILTDSSGNIYDTGIYVNPGVVTNVVLASVSGVTTLYYTSSYSTNEITMSGDSIVIGSSSIGIGVTLLSLVLKGETVTPGTISGFQASPTDYTIKPAYRGDTGLTDNAYIRFDPSFPTTGLLGGQPDVMGNMTWVIVSRGFTLTTGYMQFSPIAATFWKFEMTNLVAEPLNNPFPFTSTYNTFGPNALTPSTPATGYQGAIPPGVATQIATASGDVGLTTPTITPGVPTGSYTATEALVATDPTTATTLANVMPNFKWVNWHPGSAAPLTNGGIENYSQVNLSPVNQIGFYCGIKTLQALRSTINTGLDLPLYYERFDDTQNIASSTVPTIGGVNTSSITTDETIALSGITTVVSGEAIVVTCEINASELSTGSAFLIGKNVLGSTVFSQGVDAGLSQTVTIDYTCTVHDETITLYGVVSGSMGSFSDEVTFSAPTMTSEGTSIISEPTSAVIIPTAIVTSQEYTSGSNFTHVRFATSQSPPTELVANDQFRNAKYLSYTWDDTSDWNTLGDAQASFNSQTFTVSLIRGLTQFSASESVSVATPVVSPILAEASPPSGDIFAQGGVQSAPFVTSPKGYIFPAIRLTVISGLTYPLYVQLIDNNTSDVVVQWEVNATAGQTVEQYFSYLIGSVVAADTPLTVAVVQIGGTEDAPSTDSWSVSALSVFDPSIVWSFSTDGSTWQDAISAYPIKNNTNGALTLASPATSLYWKCQLYREDLTINSLKIRPLYSGTADPAGAPIASGPNVSFTDFDQTIYSDPEFNGWTLPIPMWWFQRYQQDSILFPDNVPFISQYSNSYYVTVDESVGPASETIAFGEYIQNTVLTYTLTTTDFITAGQQLLVSVSEAVGPANDASAWYPPTPTTISFGYTGAVQTWTVPESIFGGTIAVTVTSGSAGGFYNVDLYDGTGIPTGPLVNTSPGVSLGAIIPVTPGQVLKIYVAGYGGSSYDYYSTSIDEYVSGLGFGGWGYGTGGSPTGEGVNGSGGGGGASAIVDNATSDVLVCAGAPGGGTGPGSEVLGGSAGTPLGGAGGNTLGDFGSSIYAYGGSGGTDSAPGAGGTGNVDNGNPGSGPNGGAGLASSAFSGDGSSGGGGGGYYGGGSGGLSGAPDDGTWGGGGGGGSSYAEPNATDVSYTLEGFSGPGSYGTVIIIYTA